MPSSLLEVTSAVVLESTTNVTSTSLTALANCGRVELDLLVERERLAYAVEAAVLDIGASEPEAEPCEGFQDPLLGGQRMTATSSRSPRARPGRVFGLLSTVSTEGPPTPKARTIF